MLRLIPQLLAVAVIIFTASLISALNNGQFLTPPKGISTWCTGPRNQAGQCGRDVCTDAELRRMAMALHSSGLYELGYNKIWVDDCWEADYRLPNGSLTWDTTRFPYGMPALIDFIHSQKVEIGLYLSAGNATCDKGGRPNPIPGSEGHYADDIATLQSWGTDGIKLDWCGDVKKMPLDGIAVGAKYYKDFSNALMNSSKPGTWFQGVAAVLFLFGETPQYVNDWRMAIDHHDSAVNMFEDIIFPMMGFEPQGRPGAWGDLDVIMTGGQGCKNASAAHCPGMTDTEYITEFSIWNVVQSPLFVATDISVMTPIMKKILYNKLLLNMHQDTRTPPGKFIGGDRKNCQFLGTELCSYWLRQLADGSVFLVLLNAESTTKTIEFNFGENLKHLPSSGAWSANTTASVVDVWADNNNNDNNDNNKILLSGLLKSQTLTTGKWTASVESHGVSAVILTPVA